nr:MAG TPA: N-acetylmuramoyl-L-alanine amidase [Caudoviricetes sp.]
MDDITWIGSPNHYNGRNGYTITHITLHIMVGYLAGTDSVFKNPSTQASAHYGIGADGSIHQYVSENDGCYSDANYASNNSTISIEHEGGMAGVPCTQACMDASARLCADIARRYGWTYLWHNGLKGNIWLHREVPGTDHYGCPDNTINGLDVDYVIHKANQLLKGEDDMSAEDVWNFNQNGVKMRDRIQGTDTAANATKTELFRLSQWDNKTHASALGNLVVEQPIQGTKLGDRITGIDNKTSQLITQVTALTEAVKTLAESKGADPDTISKTVQEAVKAKLDSLKITVTDKQ